MQPGQQIHIVPQAASELLGGVDMGVDEAGENDFPGAVKGLGVSPYRLGSDVPHCSYPVVLDEHTPLGVHLLMLIHGHDIGIFQERLVHACLQLITGSTMEKSYTAKRPMSVIP
ncbi:hypothetical protein SDC9_75385 [bioreactor metagenome]|uniref:Uncharacterized protein n=1 Tax=bioreactor metagenome TaxID=1076179 RepID=A0A644YS06_9ZZZZ